MRKTYATYIMASDSGTLYTGVTGQLGTRVFQHKEGRIEGFTALYRVHKLVYYEYSDSIESAIAREKQIKGWRREKKIRLIEEHNPQWIDLTPMIHR